MTTTFGLTLLMQSRWTQRDCRNISEGYDIALFKHPERDCVYEEAELIKQIRFDSLEFVQSPDGLLSVT